MRILWYSNNRGMTGYGNQTALFAPALHRSGHHVDIAAFYGAEGGVTVDTEGIRTFPRLVDPYMHDIIGAHFAFCNAELLISLVDPFVMSGDVFGALPWCAWSPIDCAPVLPESLEALRRARWIWAMSRFGEAQLNAADLGDKVTYVPHGVDCQAFKPVDRAEARRRCADMLKTDLDGRFLVVMNGANKGTPSRKGFGYALEAFKTFSDSHPEALLWLHTEQEGTWNGEHLPTVIRAADLAPERVVFTPQYPYIMGLYGAGQLNAMYNAADVLLQSSLGEGFGLPVVEAQAAGCPVIVTDFSALPELCFAGWRVPGQMIYVAPGAQMCVPDVDGLIRALASAYEFRQCGAARFQARQGALKYDYRRVLERYMLPALEAIRRDRARQTRRQAKRQARRAQIRGRYATSV
jgi:glycosyltransferase involved in cell wall biosynthesis